MNCTQELIGDSISQRVHFRRKLEVNDICKISYEREVDTKGILLLSILQNQQRVRFVISKKSSQGKINFEMAADDKSKMFSNQYLIWRSSQIIACSPFITA